MALPRNNYNIIIINCTYKTNRYSIPLCHITGRACIKKTFNIVYTFLNRKHKETYNLVILHIKNVFYNWLPDKKPAIVIIDKEITFKNTLSKLELFSNISQIIY